MSTSDFPSDYGLNDIHIMNAVAPYTMTSTERIHALINAVRYLVSNQITGDFVECGVWKGGSVMAMALTLLELGRSDRRLFLFDTFSGMTPPGADDVDYLGQNAREILDHVRCIASQEEVEVALSRTGYARSQINFVKGRVE